MNAKISPEMRIFSPDGEPLYLNAQERARFLDAVRKEPDRNAVMFCTLLHYTGARPTELRELTIDRVFVDTSQIQLRTIKKRKKDKKGNIKQDQFRTIPIPPKVMDTVSIVFDIRTQQRKNKKTLLWPSKDNLKRPVDAKTAYRWVKRNMIAAGIEGKQATSKGLRHGFAIAMLEAEPPVPLPNLQRLMGHTSIQTTAIYLQAAGKELERMVMRAWND